MFNIRSRCLLTSVIVNKRWNSTLCRINKLLIANRGEIACRVIKTAKKLGVKTVAVYSDADVKSMHVSQADEAYNIGPPAASLSYLKGNILLDVAKRASCQAIHPGYGFLSENAEFAEECERQNVIFIGPPASAIRDMGIKSTSKHIMDEAGVPIIEGYHGEDQLNDKLQKEAERIGYPIMIKAVRGGGGKGMRIAMTPNEFLEQLESARREALKSFGDTDVLLEKFIAEPRHVEVQVFADSFGNAVHLFERDCSVQRRHQKIIEEAPAPGLSQELRMELGAAAVRAAKAVGYVGAGTVEFILDRSTHSFHFMEMNTRLQVEHPITEMITGTDLVEWQIKIASGEKLPVTQDDIKLNGHAFEARIYAENPSNGFLPGAGPLLHLCVPKASEDVRVETGVQQGDEVTVHYDPMIAKLVVWGKNRIEALSKLQANLVEYNIAGLDTNVNFLLNLARHPEFVSGNVHTNFIRDQNDTLFPKIACKDIQKIQAALAIILTDGHKGVLSKDSMNPFTVESTFRINYNHHRNIKLKLNDEGFQVKVKYLNKSSFLLSLDDGKTYKQVNGKVEKYGNSIKMQCNIDGNITNVNLFKNEEFLCIFDENGKSQFALTQPKFLLEQDSSSSESGNKGAVAPMPGVLDKILVKVGDIVKKGDPLFVLIAMKMEYVVKANKDGKIARIGFKVGENIAKDSAVVNFEE